MPEQEKTLFDLDSIDLTSSVPEVPMQNLYMIAAISRDCVDKRSVCQELMPE